MASNASSSDKRNELCGPVTEQHAYLERRDATFDDLPDRAATLVVKDKAFHRQFASIYFIRLLKLRPVIQKEAEQRWDKPSYVPKVLDVTHKRCYIIGTIYVDMKLKPNVLNDLANDHALIAPAMPAKYRSDDNHISIEDESGRIVLTGAALEKEFWVTGMIVGLLGKETSEGLFDVHEICYPGIPEQLPLPKRESAKYIALVSGLDLGSKGSFDIKTQLLTEYLSGELGGPDDQKQCSNISRLIIAGNSIGDLELAEDQGTTKKYGQEFIQYDYEPLHHLDELFEELCGTMPIDIMPGERDPANRQLPQQAMQRSLFPRSHAMKNLHMVTNPYWSKVDDVVMLGTSGQNIDDAFKYVDADTPLSLAERCMFWRHIAPSAPDTLWCYPFQDQDPFIVDQSPHVFFVGNQSKFEHSLIEGADGQKIRVIMVPSFAKTGSIVLLNLSNLDCTEIQITDSDRTTQHNENMDISE
ncbi:hypothetical protein LRAMOSA08024 [Lichtheimia ramosa]|uniref:DNA-directed DNA polymerase n=1 Tax=Lichtheimia ramosa TaxID=688394 RepID=A0A077WCU5_9FUNG|nr:hypothetical protein LRAMOSA08024 [Lichtheimia ramosa]